MRGMRFVAWLVLFSWAVVLPASAAGTDAKPGSTDAIELTYQIKMPGRPAYTTRYLVTPRFMRSDDGPGSKDFVLLDRKGRTVYSVSQSDSTVLVIPYRAIDAKRPASLKLSQQVHKDPKAPHVGGRTPVHYTFLANGKTCSDAVVVPGLLGGAVAAMREFEQIMAGQHAADMDKTPADMQTPCDLARYVFAADRQLRHGLPIQEWDPTGYRRTLTDYKPKLEVDPSLFKLPKGFRHYSVN
ncbi:MAG: hypothetical protein P8124_00520 [Gammaproteobacteria bacterium]